MMVKSISHGSFLSNEKKYLSFFFHKILLYNPDDKASSYKSKDQYYITFMYLNKLFLFVLLTNNEQKQTKQQNVNVSLDELHN